MNKLIIQGLRSEFIKVIDPLFMNIPSTRISEIGNLEFKRSEIINNPDPFINYIINITETPQFKIFIELNGENEIAYLANRAKELAKSVAQSKCLMLLMHAISSEYKIAKCILDEFESFDDDAYQFLYNILIAKH